MTSFSNNITKIIEKYKSVMILNIFLDGDFDDIKNLYIESSKKHNEHLLSNKFINAGFDLFAPERIDETQKNLICLDHKIKCSASIIDNTGKSFFTGYYLYPRSSIYKTNFRMANSTGIIDAGYRGNIMAMLDVKSQECIEKGTRMFQICAPNLAPIFVNIVDNIEELSETTERGIGGFGSSGL